MVTATRKQCHRHPDRALNYNPGCHVEFGYSLLPARRYSSWVTRLSAELSDPEPVRADKWWGAVRSGKGGRQMDARPNWPTEKPCMCRLKLRYGKWGTVISHFRRPRPKREFRPDKPALSRTARFHLDFRSSCAASQAHRAVGGRPRWAPSLSSETGAKPGPG